MKTRIAKLSTTTITIIGLLVLVTMTTHIAKGLERYQSVPLTQTQYGQEIPGHSYNDVINVLFNGSGR